MCKDAHVGITQEQRIKSAARAWWRAESGSEEEKEASWRFAQAIMGTPSKEQPGYYFVHPDFLKDIGHTVTPSQEPAPPAHDDEGA